MMLLIQWIIRWSRCNDCRCQSRLSIQPLLHLMMMMTLIEHLLRRSLISRIIRRLLLILIHGITILINEFSWITDMTRWDKMRLLLVMLNHHSCVIHHDLCGIVRRIRMNMMQVIKVCRMQRLMKVVSVMGVVVMDTLHKVVISYNLSVVFNYVFRSKRRWSWVTHRNILQDVNGREGSCCGGSALVTVGRRRWRSWRTIVCRVNRMMSRFTCWSHWRSCVLEFLWSHDPKDDNDDDHEKGSNKANDPTGSLNFSPASNRCSWHREDCHRESLRSDASRIFCVTNKRFSMIRSF